MVTAIVAMHSYARSAVFIIVALDRQNARVPTILRVIYIRAWVSLIFCFTQLLHNSTVILAPTELNSLAQYSHTDMQPVAPEIKNVKQEGNVKSIFPSSEPT
jgi:hypothetical protein